MQQKFNELKLRHDESVDERRARLADQLRSERSEYDQEVRTIAEGEATRRKEYMMQRAYQLRQEREEERQAQAETRRQQAFEQTFPELHEREVAMRAVEFKKIQEQQVRDREVVKEKEKQEALEFAAFMEEDRQRKEARHLADVARQKELALDEATVREQQIREIKARRADDAARREQEAAEMKAQWEADQAREAAEAEAKLQYKLESNRQFAEFNLRRGDELAAEAAREREEDLRLLNAQLEKEEAERQREAEAKAERIREVNEFQQQLMAQMAREREDLRHLDVIRQKELDAAWEKREQEWKLEDDRRRKLLAEVDRVRRQQIADIKDAAERRKQEDLDEKERAIRETRAIAEAEARDKARIAEQKAYYKAYLEYQLEIEEQKKQEEKLEELEEREAAAMAEADFQDRMQATLATAKYKDVYAGRKKSNIFS